MIAINNNKMGMIHVYTGDGKGKTTAALGLALRAWGHGLKILMLQFLKDDPLYGEFIAAQKLDNFEIRQVGRNCFVDFSNPDPIDVKMAEDAWQESKNAILSKKYDIIILDELNIVMAKNLINTNEVVEFLKESMPLETEIVLTGRMAPEEILKIADLITDMQEVKHYFVTRGIHSRDGIDH